MKVAHVAIVTPRKCGLYETTRELAKGLRGIGVDSRIVDPVPEKNPLMWKGEQDRGVPVVNHEWVKQADVIVNHSGLGDLEKLGKPVIYAAHGRPRHSFLNEVNGDAPVYSYHYQQNKNEKLKAVVTFWPKHCDYLRVMYPDKKVFYVQPTVDLDHWKPGPSVYDFGGFAGNINIVCTDSFRNDIDCFDSVNAYALWARKNKKLKPKLHIFGKPKDMKGWGALIRRLQDDGTMGLVQGWAAELVYVYRRANLVLTSHEIDVRTVREATATGCPVLRVRDISYSMAITEALKQIPEEIRAKAEMSYNINTAANEFKKVLEYALY